jgi:hypothetical protein
VRARVLPQGAEVNYICACGIRDPSSSAELPRSDVCVSRDPERSAVRLYVRCPFVAQNVCEIAETLTHRLAHAARMYICRKQYAAAFLLSYP